MAEIEAKHFFGGQHLNEGHGASGKSLESLMRAGQTDNVSAQTDIAALLAMVQAVADKLDADAGVTDTNYRATVDAVATTLDTATLNLTQSA